MEREEDARSAAVDFVVVGIVGLVVGGFIALNEPFGWVLVGVGGAFFNAGLIGIAVNGYGS